MIVGIIRRKPVLTYASIIFGDMLASVNSVNSVTCCGYITVGDTVILRIEARPWLQAGSRIQASVGYQYGSYIRMLF